MRLVDVLTQSGARNHYFTARPHRPHGRKRRRREHEGAVDYRAMRRASRGSPLPGDTRIAEAREAEQHRVPSRGLDDAGRQRIHDLRGGTKCQQESFLLSV
jgi:hypothetical protein